MKKDLILYLYTLLLLTLYSCSNITYHDDADWSFLVIGDMRSGYGIYKKHAITISRIEPPPVFVVNTGDIVTKPGNEVEWINYLSISKPITDKTVIYSVIGNHDVDSYQSEEIYKRFTDLPGNELYYSFNYKKFYFIFLDTEMVGEENSIVNEQYSWLEEKINSATADTLIEIIVVFMHRPLYPQGKYRLAKLANADQLHNLFKSSKVKIVVAGHEHMYNYFIQDGIHYIISGGGGAPLHTGYGGDFYHFLKFSIYENDNQLNLKVIGLNYEIIEDIYL